MSLPVDPAIAPSIFRNRWFQLSAGIVGMVAVTNLQYAWTFFVLPILDKHPNWTEAELQVAFSIFLLAETWLVPLEAYLADRHGRRLMVGIGGVLVATSWSINSVADTLAMFYLGSAVGGAGAGIVYGISMGSALQWFPDRRGLAAGLTAAAFGAGSALTVVPITRTIAAHGYERAFLWFGIAQGVIVVLTALVLRAPKISGRLTRFEISTGPPRNDFTPTEMVRTPVFWLIYAMMTLATVGGLMATAQLAPMAESYNVAHVPIAVLGLFTVTALELAAQVDRVMNGVTRPLFGWFSDRVGRENALFIAFVLEGAAIWLLLAFAHVPILFVLFSGLTFFAWGEIYSTFPALCGDMFGKKFAATNYGILYTAKGTAALLVPLGGLLREQTGSWVLTFSIAIAFDWLVALAALFILKPLRARVR